MVAWIASLKLQISLILSLSLLQALLLLVAFLISLNLSSPSFNFRGSGPSYHSKIRQYIKCTDMRGFCHQQRWTNLIHWGRMTHTVCVSNLTIIVSDNGLSPGRHQAIIWTNAGILLIGPLGANFIAIFIGIQTFSLKKCSWRCRLRNGVHFVSASMGQNQQCNEGIKFTVTWGGWGGDGGRGGCWWWGGGRGGGSGVVGVGGVGGAWGGGGGGGAIGFSWYVKSGYLG